MCYQNCFGFTQQKHSSALSAVVMFFSHFSKAHIMTSNKKTEPVILQQTASQQFSV